MANDSLQAVAAEIKKHQTVVIISHYNPDADAYGSSLGLAASLQAMGKKVQVINESGIVPRYESLPNIHTIQKNLPLSVPFLISCDCGALKRIGDSQIPAFNSAKSTINIDHHISNDHFGMMNLVVETASSASEIIFELLTAGDFPINAEVASCLMAGIIGDTGSFRYSATSARTFEIGAALVRLGAKPYELYRELYASPAISAVRLQSEALSKVEIDLSGQYAEVIVPEEMVARNGAALDDTDGLAEKARDIKGIKIGASLRQDGNLWRVSLRSISEKFDVSLIAQSFGGGGHRQAAAFRITRPIEAVRKALRAKVEETLAEQQKTIEANEPTN